MSEIEEILTEYARVFNYTVEKYEDLIKSNKKDDKGISKFDFMNVKYVHPVISETGTFLANSLVFECFGEVYAAVQGAKASALNREDKKYFSPMHLGKKITLSAHGAITEVSINSKEFDYFVKLRCLRNDKGRGYSITIPLKRHRQFNKWANLGKLANSITLSKKYIQFSFEINVAEKKEEGHLVGFDFGMKRLGTLSNGNIIGKDIEKLLYQLQLKKRCSKAYYRKKEEIRSYINEEIKKIDFSDKQLIVVEQLKDMKYKMKERGRLSKNIRSVFYNLSYRQVLDRIQALSEENRVSFRSVPAYYTSITCSRCGHVEKANRLSQESFVCQKCGYSDNADFNASINILKRFATGKYGSSWKGIYDLEYPQASSE